MITACRALSIRRLRSSSDGKNDPDSSFGIFNSTSPLVVDTVFGRFPLRWVVGLGALVMANAEGFGGLGFSSCRPARIGSANTDAASQGRWS